MTLLAKLSKEDLGSRMPAGFVSEFGVQAWRLDYVESDGSPASSLLVLPRGAAHPRWISYSHPTLGTLAESPTNSIALGAGSPSVELALASQGYAVVSADGTGFGASAGSIHPYMEWEPAARSAMSAMSEGRKACVASMPQIDCSGAWASMGYSEGAYVGMAVLRALAARRAPKEQWPVLAALGAGPYDVSGTLGWARSKLSELNPALGLLLDPSFAQLLSAAQRSELATALEALFAPSKPSSSAEAAVAYRMGFIGKWLSGDKAGLSNASDVLGFESLSPVFLFHSRADELLPYLNMESALAAWNPGSPDAVAQSSSACDAPTPSHSSCFAAFVDQSLPKIAAALGR